MNEPDSGNQIKKLLASYAEMMDTVVPRQTALEQESRELKEKIQGLEERWERFNVLWEGDGSVDGSIGYRKVIADMHDHHIKWDRVKRTQDLLDATGEAEGQKPLWDVIYGSRSLQKWVAFIGTGLGALFVQQAYRVFTGE
jgi:hypothetical protein